jgi:ATP-binding cassette subfamily B protein RaxB
MIGRAKTPDAILQSATTECGLACIAMVCHAHGMKIGLRELRRRFPLSMKGATLGRIIHMAQQLGFRPRPLRLELEQLSKLRTPAILHWNLNHFVVLVEAGPRTITVLDPASGRQTLRYEEVSKHFTGIALELSPGDGFAAVEDEERLSLRAMVRDVRGLRRSLLLVLMLSLALQAFVMLAPFYTQWVVDQVLVSADRDLMVVLALGFLLTLVLQACTGALRGWAIVFLSSRLNVQWLSNVFAHITRLPLDYFEKRHLGDIVSRMSSVQVIQRTLTGSFVETVIDGMMAVVTLGMMLFYSAKLALVTLCAVALYLVVRAAGYGTLRRLGERQLNASARQHTHLVETVRGMQSVKVSGLEGQRRATYENLATETVDQDARIAWFGVAFGSANQLIFGVERIVVIWIAALLAIDNTFSVGMLIAYLAYKDQFAERTAGLVDRWVEFRMLRLHADRLGDILLEAPDADAGNEYDIAVTQDIEVEGLSFRYADGEPWVLKDCSFRIAAGESVAIVGPSGCGKSTLLKLMLGLLVPTSGRIRVGGRDLVDIGARNFRARAGVVMQDDQVFAGSLADNIALFDPEFDEARVEAAARMADLHDEIAAMPMGYRSLIGDMGSSLSGGQRQRLILARALYRNPLFLFLDEATSHLDIARERRVNEAVEAMPLTRVIVAHRPETIASADRCLLLDGGQVVEPPRIERHEDGSLRSVPAAVRA